MHENPRSNFQTHATGKTVVDSVNIETAGITLSLFQDVWLIESSLISIAKSSQSGECMQGAPVCSAPSRLKRATKTSSAKFASAPFP